MVRFVARRLLLSLITLWLLATIVFVIANVLPNDVGRTILGPFAPQAAVDQLNQRLGTDRPIVLLGVTSSSIPEFVTGTILVVVVGVQLGWLPVLATAPPTADVLTQTRYLLMPATAMAIVYFGYI